MTIRDRKVNERQRKTETEREGEIKTETDRQINKDCDDYHNDEMAMTTKRTTTITQVGVSARTTRIMSRTTTDNTPKNRVAFNRSDQVRRRR